MFKSDTIVLFIHGILESPRQFEDMRSAVAKKCDTAFLLLPGHGKTGKDFAESSMKKWKSYFARKLNYYRHTHENIFITAHSMGCLLAVSEAVENPDKISGLFLIANPLSVKINKNGVKNALRVAYNMFYKKDKNSNLIKKVYSVSECKLTDYPRWLPRYRELVAESRRIREMIHRLSVPTYNVFSLNDEFVSIESADYLAKVKNYKLLILENSGHFYYVAKERAKIINEFIFFINENTE